MTFYSSQSMGMVTRLPTTVASFPHSSFFLSTCFPLRRQLPMEPWLCAQPAAQFHSTTHTISSSYGRPRSPGRFLQAGTFPLPSRSVTRVLFKLRASLQESGKAYETKRDNDPQPTCVPVSVRCLPVGQCCQAHLVFLGRFHLLF